MWKFLLVLTLVWAAEAVPTGSAREITGYESCTQPKDGLLNVHIVPHTHDDVGWLKTVDQYYYGSRNLIQKAGVQYIIDSVVKELWEDPKRRFIYVETAFFWKWWNLQPDSIKSKVNTLVTEGRLQFVGGAWSMNDEATTYYQSIIDQFTWGLSKLRDAFGAYGRPRVGWQIDPFGHSREFASLLAAMGYDGLFLGRIDYQDKRTRQDLNTMEMVWRGDDSLEPLGPKVACPVRPSLLAAMGYDGLFLGRIDYQDKRTRQDLNTMEMVWRGDDSLGKSSDIFTGVLYNTYSPPPGFCFDVLCADEPIIDDPSSPDYNVDRRVNDFLDITKHMSESYSTNNILVTMGEDFHYQDAAMWYKNLDKLIEYSNLKAAKDGKNITLFYSTPNCYLKAVKDATPTLPIKQDDFFPYASDPHAYWTGYFTSRPAIKYLEAQTNTYLQVVKQLQLLGALPEHNMPLLDELKSAMGVLQHHDAVTGTEKQHVTHDYVRMATQAAEDAHTITTQALNRNIFGDDATQQLVFDRCHFNESRCDTTEEATGNLIITIYNPLAWPVISPVQIPVVDGEYEIVDGQGVSQTVQISEISKTILELPSRVSKAKKDVTFIANLPPLGYKSFYMSRKQKRTVRDIKIEEISDIDEYFEKIKKKNYVELAMDNDFDNDVLVYTNIPDEPKKINRNNYYNSDKMAKALLKSKEGKDKNVEEFEKLFVESSKPKRPRQDENSYPYISGDEMRMLADDPMVVERFEELNDEALKKPGNSHHITTQGDYTFTASHWYYPAAIGNNEIYENRSSGAYIFRPSSNTPVELKFKDYKQIDGPLFSETRITTENNAAFTYRFYNHRKIPYHELDFVVGPINIDDGVGKEFIVRYETNIVTNGEFYTDSNGRQLIKRKLNKRPQYNLTVEEPVAGNYYPVVSVAGLTDDKGDVYLNVLPDRAVGVASLQEGNLEVMLHRRLLHDDAFGVGEALNETEFGKGLVVRGTHRFFFTLDKRTFKDVLEMRNKPQVFVSNADGINLENWKKLTNERSWLKSELPDGVHLLTLEPFGNRMFLLRLENFLEESESSSRVVDLAKLLTFTTISSLQETVLSANAGLHEKWTWNTEKQFSDNFNKEYGSFGDVKLPKDKPKVADDSYKINLAAKQIRTFIASL